MNSLFFCRYVCRIPVKELQITYSASSGPGGQAINKSSSKVLIKFRPKNCTVLTAEQKDVLHKHGSFSQTGTLIVSSEKTRSQSKNLDDAMNKLERKLKEILEPKLPEPLTPEEIEKLDKGKLKAEKKRLEQKRYRGSIKKERKGIFYE
ncbi:large ribosomal subunit protein mL62 [Lepeophtheirus salmonis]|nr:peptidyl-tRNA hydrolase ICT1, mitochondrial-like [Lepeophtheirus salmonis]